MFASASAFDRRLVRGRRRAPRRRVLHGTGAPLAHRRCACGVFEARFPLDDAPLLHAAGRDVRRRGSSSPLPHRCIDPDGSGLGRAFPRDGRAVHGSNPPLEALGVSAKLFSNGKAATAQSMLELPGSGESVRANARTRRALACHIDAWLDVLVILTGHVAYGFELRADAVDADAGGNKYVLCRDGEALPQLPMAAEAVMPPVFSNGTHGKCIEWRVGDPIDDGARVERLRADESPDLSAQNAV